MDFIIAALVVVLFAIVLYYQYSDVQSIFKIEAVKYNFILDLFRDVNRCLRF